MERCSSMKQPFNFDSNHWKILIKVQKLSIKGSFKVLMIYLRVQNFLKIYP